MKAELRRIVEIKIANENWKPVDEVDAKHIVWATLTLLFRENKITADALEAAKVTLGIDENKINPMVS